MFLDYFINCVDAINNNAAYNLNLNIKLLVNSKQILEVTITTIGYMKKFDHLNYRIA